MSLALPLEYCSINSAKGIELWEKGLRREGNFLSLSFLLAVISRLICSPAPHPPTPFQALYIYSYPYVVPFMEPTLCWASGLPLYMHYLTSFLSFKSIISIDLFGLPEWVPLLLFTTTLSPISLTNIYIHEWAERLDHLSHQFSFVAGPLALKTHKFSKVTLICISINL